MDLKFNYNVNQREAKLIHARQGQNTNFSRVALYIS